MIGTRRRAAAAIAPVVLVAIATWLFVWSPTRSDAAGARRERSELEVSNESLAADLAVGRDFADDPAAGDQLDALRVAVPDDTRMDEFVVQHAEIAAATGVIVSSLVPDLPDADVAAAPSGSSATGLNITVIGTLAQTMEYLDALASAERLVVVDAIDVSAETETTLATAVQARIFDTSVPDDELELDEFGEPIDGEFEEATDADLVTG